MRPGTGPLDVRLDRTIGRRSGRRGPSRLDIARPVRRIDRSCVADGRRVRLGAGLAWSGAHWSCSSRARPPAATVHGVLGTDLPPHRDERRVHDPVRDPPGRRHARRARQRHRPRQRPALHGPRDRYDPRCPATSTRTARSGTSPIRASAAPITSPIAVRRDKPGAPPGDGHAHGQGASRRRLRSRHPRPTAGPDRHARADRAVPPRPRRPSRPRGRPSSCRRSRSRPWSCRRHRQPRRSRAATPALTPVATPAARRRPVRRPGRPDGSSGSPDATDRAATPRRHRQSRSSSAPARAAGAARLADRTWLRPSCPRSDDGPFSFTLVR